MQALILVAGRGEKLDPLTKKRPKYDIVVDYFGNGNQLEFNIKYIIQAEQKGIGDAFIKAENEFYIKKK